MSMQLVAHILQIFSFLGRKKSFEQFGVWILCTVNYPEQLSWGGGGAYFMLFGQMKIIAINDFEVY